MRLQFIILAALWSVASPLFSGAQQASVVRVGAIAMGEIPLSSPTETAMVNSPTCDGPGNVYSRTFDPLKAMTQFEVPIQETAPGGKLAGRFSAADTRAGGSAFFVDYDGRVYELLTHDGYEVVQFARDGSLRSRTKLELDARASQVQPSHLGVFASGGFLLVGTTF